jgi:hypothetical protein
VPGSGLVIAEALVSQHFAVVPDGSYANRSVVVDVPDLATAAGVVEVVIREALVVALDAVIAMCVAPTWRHLLGKCVVVTLITPAPSARRVTEITD